LKKIKKNEIFMTIIIGLVTIVLFSVMFMQFKTIEETDITAIENMRETELRTAIAEWKSKYEQTIEQLEANRKSTKEYKEKIEKDEEASDLIDKDLEESNMKLGKTTVYGEGITLTLSNTNEYIIEPFDLIDLFNELRYAGAEAISINDVRVLSSTSVAQPEGSLIVIDGKRLVSPFVIKAIGNPTYLSSNLSLKDSGYIDKNRARGMKISDIEIKRNIEIVKDNNNRDIKYMKEVEE
jgi:uncharacterized protein YlxW (UPF0749 family)